MLTAFDETIAAVATAMGPAGLAVVRVSGPAALGISARLFHGAAGLVEAPGDSLHHGWIVCPESGRRLDEVVASIFRAPRSYTGEDTVEISCHGGSLPARRVLDALLRTGGRMARPGEFTQRAFLNGRIDLAQAEAVADLIHAETEAGLELALAQLAGGLSRRLAGLSESIADALAEVEARVDFAEDVGGVEVPPAVVAAIESAEAGLAEMLAGAAYARAVREGVRVPVVGRPNVGKSSLFNALVGEDRAIVTPHPGTTRDRVSEAIEVAGVRVTLCDTAGLRETEETVEAIGVHRTREAIEESALLLWVVDGSAPLAGEDLRVADQITGKRVLVALNKRDLGGVVAPPDVAGLLNASEHRVVSVSAARGDGLDALRASLGELLGQRSEVGHDESSNGTGALDLGAVRAPSGPAVAVGNLRHAEALSRARDALCRAAAAARAQAPGEIVSIELREALSDIDEVTGKGVGEDLLDRIFSRFCVGK